VCVCVCECVCVCVCACVCVCVCECVCVCDLGHACLVVRLFANAIRAAVLTCARQDAADALSSSGAAGGGSAGESSLVWVALVRVFSGSVRPGQQVRLSSFPFYNNTS
jgi:hypothetical protein